VVVTAAGWPDWLHPADLSALARVAVALCLGGLIGWEREAAKRPAGLRTHMLVAMAAALFVVLGDHVVDRFAGQPNDVIRSDPLRIIEAVVAGVSFLGAGTIFTARSARAGGHVQGLTTAASIWLTAAVGLAVGVERYVLAIGSTLLALAVLLVLGMLTSDAAHPQPAESPPAETDTDQQAPAR
jgi:putative Mg2+ transporter-C (MgtC) family protein